MILGCYLFVFLIGLHPEVPYNVSVRILYYTTAGAASCAIAFTRQGGLYQNCATLTQTYTGYEVKQD